MLPELYHAHHNLHLEDLPFWLELASQAGDPVLELGCGTGRILTPLAQAGHRCIGLDHDLGMLRFLKAGLEPHLANSLILVAADISQFSLAEQFTLVILPCNTFSILSREERQSCLRCVSRHLRTGGIFATSIPNPGLLEQLPSTSQPEFEDEFIHPRTGNPVQVSSAWQRTKHAFAVTWLYDQLFPDGTVERSTVETVHQRHSTQTYLDDIQAAGFRILKVYGDFDRSDYSLDSPYLIILATC